jgi:hypothetical protein
MTRKHPNARRAVALAILTSILLAANAGALFIPSQASAAAPTPTGKRPLPGDPNIPDEGGRSGTLTVKSTDPKTTSAWVVILIKDVTHYIFLAR